MSRNPLLNLLAIGLTFALTLAAANTVQAQLSFGNTTGGTTGGTNTTGGTGGGTSAVGNQVNTGASGQQLNAAAGAGTVTGNERYYRAPTYTSVTAANTQPTVRFMGADSFDVRNFRSAMALQPQSVYTSGVGATGFAAGAGAAGRTTGGAAAGTSTLGNALGRSTTGGGLNSGLNSLGGGLGGGLGGLNLAGGGSGGLGGLGGQAGGQTGTNPTPRVRAQMTVAFNPPQAPSSQLRSQIAQRLAKARQIQSSSPVQVEMAGGVVVLRGVVQSQHARELAERLVMLEPGVSTVQNELSVASTPVGGGN